MRDKINTNTEPEHNPIYIIQPYLPTLSDLLIVQSVSDTRTDTQELLRSNYQAVTLYRTD